MACSDMRRQADRDRQQARIQQQQETEQQGRVGAVCGNSRKVGDEQQRQGRTHDRRVLERILLRCRAAKGSAAAERQRRDRQHRKDGEDAEGRGQLAVGEEPVHPSPLINRRQDHVSTVSTGQVCLYATHARPTFRRTR